MKYIQLIIVALLFGHCASDDTAKTATATSFAVSLAINSASMPSAATSSALYDSTGKFVGGSLSNTVTNASGVATVVLQTATSAGCLSGTTAAVSNGTYKLYFLAAGTIGYTSAACDTTKLFLTDATKGYSGNVTVSGAAASVSLTNTNIVATVPLTLNLTVTGGGATAYACGVLNSTVTTIASALTANGMQLRTGNLVSGVASIANFPVIPNAAISIYCYADTNSSGARNTGDQEILLANQTYTTATTVTLNTFTAVQ